MMKGNMLFSQEALDKLRSPDRLDKMFSITKSLDWMLIVAVMVFLFAIVLWSIFGAFTEKIDGMGLITDSAGVAVVTPASSGKLDKIYVKTGDVVSEGDLLARVEQIERTMDARMTQNNMNLSKNDKEAMSRIYEYNAKREQNRAIGEIRSDYRGVVDEVIGEPGMMISPDRPLCTIRLTQDTDELSGVLFIPVEKGKRVEKGMMIQLVPNGVEVSESGSLVGVVRSVSQYPVSMQGIQKSLGNSHFAGWIAEAQKSALMEVRFDLVKDADSPSGYLWTSVVGKHPPITPGSFCKGSIVIDSKPPIEKVFYKISQWLRSR